MKDVCLKTFSVTSGNSFRNLRLIEVYYTRHDVE